MGSQRLSLEDCDRVIEAMANRTWPSKRCHLGTHFWFINWEDQETMWCVFCGERRPSQGYEVGATPDHYKKGVDSNYEITKRLIMRQAKEAGEDPMTPEEYANQAVGKALDGSSLWANIAKAFADGYKTGVEGAYDRLRHLIPEEDQPEILGPTENNQKAMSHAERFLRSKEWREYLHRLKARGVLDGAPPLPESMRQTEEEG